MGDLIDELGLDDEGELQAWIDEEGVEAVKSWLSPEARPSEIIADWANKSGHTHRCKSVMAETIRETVLCQRLGELALDLTQYGGAARAIRTSRENVAFSLERSIRTLERANLRQQRRLLRLAVNYFRHLLDETKWNLEIGAPLIACRYGKSVMRLARIEAVGVPELLDARQYLSGITDKQVIQDEGVRSFILESHLRVFELNADPEELMSAKAIASEVSSETSYESSTILAEFWCRAADASGNTAARSAFLGHADAAIENAEGSATGAPFQHATLAVLRGIASGIRACTSRDAMRELSVPFVTRRLTSVHSTDCRQILESVLLELESEAEGGEYIFRDLSATVLSALARSELIPPSDSVRMLRRAVALRDGKKWHNTLAGEQTEIDQSLDLLKLAEITGEEALRARAVKLLLDLVTRYPASPHALAQLGVQAEVLGPHSAVIPIPPGLLMDPELVREVRAGDATKLYERTARRALAIGTLPQRNLGGRRAVILIEERSGSSSFTLVIKRMARARLELDLKRTNHLRDVLRRETQTDFGVIEHIAHYETDDPRHLRTPLVSVRRYELGSTLAHLLKIGGREADAALTKTASFLAIAHARPYSLGPASGVRKELRAEELGCWLKRIVPKEEVLEYFNRWYELLPPGLPLVERRDAHAFNWLVDSEQKVLALDLDCTGWRPLGYELAQLTEDVAVLGPDDSSTRQAAISAYAMKYESLVGQLDHESLTRSYFVSCVARWIRTLSDNAVDDSARLLATRNLEALASSDDVDLDVRKLVADLLAHWTRRTGVARSDRLEQISAGTRRRISRAMAHHLRHDESTPMTPDGWVDATVVADALREQGHPVTAERILLVAGALGERRFEINGESVRASYGHSRAVKIYAETTETPDGPLYHATSTRNLRSIFEAKDGVRPMKRNFVHMSTQIFTALRAAQRRHEATVVAEVDYTLLKDLYKTADTTTWLTSRVPIGALSVLPVFELERRRRLETQGA